MFTIVHNGHTIKIQPNTAFTAVETVWYDDKQVSRHTSLAGSHHDFVVEEGGAQAHYEVSIGLTFSPITFIKVKLLRNGELIFSVE